MQVSHDARARATRAIVEAWGYPLLVPKAGAVMWFVFFLFDHVRTITQFFGASEPLVL